jgi:hypothetical protein
LFAGEEGVAVGANFHVEIARRRTRFHHMAAGASNGRTLIFRMDRWFHKTPLKQSIYNTSVFALQCAATAGATGSDQGGWIGARWKGTATAPFVPQHAFQVAGTGNSLQTPGFDC